MTTLHVSDIVIFLIYQHDQNFVVKPVAHNLLHTFCCLIESSYFLASKRPFNITQKTSTFSSCFTCLFCEIFTDFYVNVGTTFILLLFFLLLQVKKVTIFTCAKYIIPWTKHISKKHRLSKEGDNIYMCQI